ncbi:MAG: BadF/BadG/BcrA/BcrD ATPase family protein [Melioribacteraceae bacterium]|nr:BadF/BadG/BcrA/BcrD ATPase family protein [Melioribacteraceae bacterium]
MNLYIGIDGGGSKTKCVLCDESLNIISEFQSGPSNFLTIGTEKVSQTILELVKKCCEDQNIDSSIIKRIVFGTTGAGRESDAENISRAILKTAKSSRIAINSMSVVSDARIALEGAFSGNAGSILIAGTGSIMFGKDRSGIIHRVGGFGRLIGDEGSGLTIGRLGLNIVAKCYDGRIASSLLKDKVESKFQINNQNQLIIEVYNENLKVQTVAPLVMEAAEEGDRHCLEILDKQTDELMIHIMTMKEKLKDDEMKLVLIGGTVTSENKYSQMLKDKIRVLMPKIILQKPEHPPEIGAVIMAKGIE